MALVASVDYAAKRIYLSSSTMDADLDTLNVYREVRALRRTTEAHRKYRPMIVAGGNIPKITGVTYTPAYAQLLYGCRIVPYNSSHKIRLTRDTFTDDGLAGRDCFDRVSLSPSVDVDIDVDIQEVEIRVVSTGGSALTAPESAKLMGLPSATTVASATRTELQAELLRILELGLVHGLDPAHPLVITQNSRTAGAVSQTLGGDGTTTETVTRV